jgi:energy-coupling factor transport system permease protein
MSDFEFQRFITIGQYLPTQSPIHQLDPRTRLIAAGCLLVAITAAPHLAGLALSIIVLLGLMLLAHIPLRYAWKGIIAPLPFILFLVLLQILLSPNTTTQPWVSFGPLQISAASITDGVKILLRFPALILTITLLSACTATTEAVRGLDALLQPLAKLGLPIQDFVLIIQVALRFLPLLAREAERIAKSQASRGADWGTGRGGPLRRARQALPILVPLFLISLTRAENLALAMEARGYRGQAGRTSLVTFHFQRRDALALLIVVSLTFAILIFR